MIRVTGFDALVLKSDAVKKDKPRRLSHPKCEYGNTQDTGNLLYLKLFTKHTVVLLW